MKQRYDYFKYSLPEKPAEYYVGRALPILEELRERFPKQYKKAFRYPSEVLTISGVRAFDTYYALGKTTSAKEIAEVKKFLTSYDILVLEETFTFAGIDNKQHNFSLLNLEGLNDLPNRYGYIPGWTPYLREKAQNEQEFFYWWTLWSEKAALEFFEGGNKLPFNADEDTLNWWTPNDITFGMLLGYPGEAISTTLWFDLSKPSYELQNSVVKHADKFDGAQPIYNFAKELLGNKNIVGHQKLWSDILTGVYTELSE